MLDSAEDIELDAIATNVAEAQVIALYFPLMRKTLLLDTRTSASDGPMVCVVEMVNTTQERVRSLRRMRPRFSRPDSITMIPWLRRVDTLRDAGVWEHIGRRLMATGGPDAVASGLACLEELRAFEQREYRRAITGERYQTLWGRRGLGDRTS
jgi:hypothetical protein